MAGNLAKKFANMTLLYWKPIMGGGGVTYERPVECKGKYIGNMQLEPGGVSDVIYSGGGKNRDNMVLFYMCEPEPEGFVSWKDTLNSLDAEGITDLPPSEIRGTHKVKSVTTIPMLGAKASELKNLAFIASVM